MAHPDAYYEMTNGRSPNSYQAPGQTIHRQSSRHFDQYGQTNAGLYTAEDHAARYDTNRYDTARLSALTTNYGYDNTASQTWNPQSFGSVNNIGSLSNTGRVKGVSTRGQRSALPTGWLDTTPLPGVNLGLGAMPLGPQPLRADTVNSDPDEELIPTAIVIKNIPFAVKKEQLVHIMTDMDLPLPYAFNYHFDNGVFRGLAFANFTTAEETALVIQALNHHELQGRKLRVEYKKMLPIAERERIEKLKREKRGQLEEQHRPLGGQQVVQHQSSMQSLLPSLSPRPNSSSAPGLKQGPIGQIPLEYMGPTTAGKDVEIDLNNPQTLQFYSQLLLFRDDHTREALIFPSTLSPSQRRIVHTLAHHMSLAHISRGTGENRQVQVFRQSQPVQSISPPNIPTVIPVESHGRRTLARATTMDFSETRSADGGVGIYSTIGRQAKSFADLRSYTPSPVPTSASFPTNLRENITRYQNEYANGNSTTPSLTPTAQQNSINETLLVNGLAGVSIGPSLVAVGNGSLRGDPRDARGLLGSDGGMHGAIGGLSPSQTTSTRNFSMTYDDQRDRGSQILPTRQPRGPDSERSVGFGRGSTRQVSARQNPADLDGQHQQQQSVEITVE